MARDTGFEAGDSRAGTRGFAPVGAQVRAGSRASLATERAPSSVLPAFLQASAQLAAAAAERDDLATARRLLEEAIRAIEAADVRPVLQIVRGQEP